MSSSTPTTSTPSTLSTVTNTVSRITNLIAELLPASPIVLGALAVVGTSLATYRYTRQYQRMKVAPKWNAYQHKDGHCCLPEEHPTLEEYFTRVIQINRERERTKKLKAGSKSDEKSDDDDADIIYRAPNKTDEKEIMEIAEQTSVSFNNFNASVGLPLEFPDMKETQDLMKIWVEADESLVAVRRSTGEILGSVFNNELDIAHGAVGCGPWSVKWGARQSGIGRRLIEKLILTTIRHGAKSIRLMQISANLTSYSLYTSLGFVSREPITMWGGYLRDDVIEATFEAAAKLGWKIRQMTEDDVARCDSMHQEALNLSRKNDLTNGVHGVEAPTKIVAVDAKGNILGFNTGMTEVSYTITTSHEVFKFLISYAQKEFKRTHPAPTHAQPFIHTFPRLYPDLECWLLNSGNRVQRVNNHMVLGEWTPILFEKYVYASTILY